jgi:hypothetical protein
MNYNLDGRIINESLALSILTQNFKYASPSIIRLIYGEVLTVRFRGKLCVLSYIG